MSLIKNNFDNSRGAEFDFWKMFKLFEADNFLKSKFRASYFM